MYYGLAYLVIKQQLLCCVNTGRACSLWEPKEYDGAGTAMRSMINLTLFGLIMALVIRNVLLGENHSGVECGLLLDQGELAGGRRLSRTDPIHCVEMVCSGTTHSSFIAS